MLPSFANMINVFMGTGVTSPRSSMDLVGRMKKKSNNYNCNPNNEEFRVRKSAHMKKRRNIIEEQAPSDDMQPYSSMGLLQTGSPQYNSGKTIETKDSTNYNSSLPKLG